MTHITPNAVQSAFRGRNDTVVLNSTTFDYALNTNFSQTVDAVFRIRLEVEETAGASFSVGGQLEANLNGGAFQSVTTTSTIVRAIASGQFNEGDATTNILASSARGFIAGTGSEDGLGAAVSLSNQQTEYEFALQIMSADVANGNTIQLRIAGLSSYTQIPTITAVVPVPAISLSPTTFNFTGQAA